MNAVGELLTIDDVRLDLDASNKSEIFATLELDKKLVS